MEALRGRSLRIEIPERKRQVHQMVVPVRWGDMDAMGYVNNTAYFRYMASARIAWLRELGAQPNPDGEGVVIANAFCNFMRQFEYPGNVLVCTYVSNLGRSSFDTWVTMAHAEQPEQICAASGATIVWVDFPRQKAVPVPGWLRHVVQGDDTRTAVEPRA